MNRVRQSLQEIPTASKVIGGSFGGLSVATFIWMMATFTPKDEFVRHQQSNAAGDRAQWQAIQQNNRDISYIQGKLGIQQTTMKGQTNENQ